MENREEDYSDVRGERGISARDVFHILEARKKGKEEFLKVMREIWSRSEVEEAGSKK